MDEKTIRDLLFQTQVGIRKTTYTKSSNGTRWMNISCPFAPWTHAKKSDNNPSFGITIVDDGRSHYKCFSCGQKGRLSSLPSKLGAYRKKDYSKIRHWAELAELQAKISRPVVDWEQDERRNDEPTRSKQRASRSQSIERYPRAYGIPYLRERGIVWPTPYRLGLHFDHYQQRLLFPCYDRSDVFRGFTGRSVLPSSTYSKRNPKVRDYFGLDKRKLFLSLPKKLRKPDTPTIIVEGLFDYARLVQAGYSNARAILGTALTPEKIDILISEGDPVYFFMDNDLAGWNALFGALNEEDENQKDQSWAFKLYEEIPVWIVPYPNEFDGTDPGSLSNKQIHDAIKSAHLFTGRVPNDAFTGPHLMAT